MKLLPSLVFQIFIFMALDIAAQEPSATFTMPIDGATDVLLEQAVILETNYRIDTSSFQDLYDPKPNLIILEKYYYEKYPDSIWKYFAYHGEYSFENVFQIKFISYGFHFSTEYVAVLTNLKVLVPKQNHNEFDTVLVSKTISFKTLHGPLHIKWSSLSEKSNFYHCGDTLQFLFNRQIDSLTTWRGDVITLIGEDSIGYEGNELKSFTSPVPAKIWLNQDSTLLSILPIENLKTGGRYYVDISLGYLTGDLSDFDKIYIQMRTVLRLEISAKTVDSTDKIPDYFQLLRGRIGARDLFLDDTIYASAPKYIDNLKFIKWICPQEKLINECIEREIMISRSCYNACDLDITVIYDKKNKLSINFEDVIDKNQFSIFPNPASDYIVIKTSEVLEPMGSSTIGIYNALGECVKSPQPQPFSQWEKGVRVDVSDLPVGIYFVKMGYEYLKFVKI